VVHTSQLRQTARLRKGWVQKVLILLKALAQGELMNQALAAYEPTRPLWRVHTKKQKDQKYPGKALLVENTIITNRTRIQLRKHGCEPIKNRG